MLCMLKICVEKDSKYTIRTHEIFAYNFLNIQPIFNLKKVLKSCDFPTIPSNAMHVEACWRSQRSK